MRLAVEAVGWPPQGMVGQLGRRGQLTAGADLPGQSGRRDPALRRRRERPQAGVRQERFDEGLVRAPRHEWRRPAQRRGARETAPSHVGLDRLDGPQERRLPALLVRLDDDLAPVAEPDPEHAPGRGTVEEPLVGLGPERLEAEPVDDRRDLRRVAGAEHVGVDDAAAPLGVLRRNDPLHRCAHVRHRPTAGALSHRPSRCIKPSQDGGRPGHLAAPRPFRPSTGLTASYNASTPRSPVRTRTTASTGMTQTLPSPILPVEAELTMASTTSST